MHSSDVYQRRQELSLSPLPVDVPPLLAKIVAPARLIAHLLLVHDVARQLLIALKTHWPALSIDQTAILFGAATHDIGKALLPQELSAPGHAHEAAGNQWLIDAGVAPTMARFCITHAAWQQINVIEDLLVSLADHCWKGKRVESLEARVIEQLMLITGAEQWQIYSWLDQLLTEIGEQADARLNWQQQFSTSTTN